MQKKQLMIKNMSFVSIGIMISRIFGYFRDMLVASVFGAGFYADAFYAAFRIPNLFRRLFGESSLNAAFVPVFSEYLQKEDRTKIEEFLSAVTTVMVVLLGIITLVGITFALPLTKIITWGFPKDKLLLTAKLLQIMFPYMILICLAALGLSVLNCLNIFFIPAMSSASLSIAEIVFILFIVNLLPQQQRIVGLAISVLAGGVLQFLINHTMVNKRYKIQVRLDKFFVYLRQPEVKKIYFLFIPVVVGFSIDQINALVDTLCASFLKEGSVTALYYSNRVMQLPLALFAISLTTVALPQMSKEVVSNNHFELKQTVVNSLVNIFLLILPASIGLIILGKPMLKLLFERGNFTAEATAMTYSCLAFYSAGLLFFSTTKILTSVFYALKKPKYPVKIAAGMLVLNATLNVILMQIFEVGGLALATSLTSLVSTILLFLKLKKYVDFPLTELRGYCLKIFFANGFLILFLLFLKMYFKNIFLLTVSGILFGAILYFTIIKLLKIEEAEIITRFVNRITSGIYKTWTR